MDKFQITFLRIHYENSKRKFLLFLRLILLSDICSWLW